MYIDGKEILNKVEKKFISFSSSLQKQKKNIHIFQFIPENNIITPRHLSAVISTKQKVKTLKTVGVNVKSHVFNENISVIELNRQISQVVDNPETGGIIVQVPVPENLIQCFSNIPDALDIDNISENSEHFLSSATAETAFRILESFWNDGDKVLINGYGFIGKGIGKYLNKHNVNFDFIDFNKKEVIVQSYNIVISCSGNPEIIKKGFSKSQKLVVDIGFSPIVDDKTNDIFIYGDVHYSMHENVEIMSPVPGGMGPLEMAMILERITKLWFFNENLWGIADVKQSLREISPDELYVKRCTYKFNELFKNVEFVNNQ